MSCTSCGGAPTFMAEHFTEETQDKGNCPAKKMMNNCLYTTQGMFVCDVDPNGEKKVWGTSQNMDMMGEAVRDKNVFKNTAPWETK